MLLACRPVGIIGIEGLLFDPSCFSSARDALSPTHLVRITVHSVPVNVAISTAGVVEQRLELPCDGPPGKLSVVVYAPQGHWDGATGNTKSQTGSCFQRLRVPTSPLPSTLSQPPEGVKHR